MNDIQQIIATVVGILMIAFGLILIAMRREGAASHLKIMGFEANLSTPALVIIIAGCALFSLPLFVPHRPNTWGWRASGTEAVAKVGSATLFERQSINASEVEPNDIQGQANVLQFGVWARGSLREEDRDYYVVAVPEGSKSANRLIINNTTGQYYTVRIFNGQYEEVLTDFRRANLSHVLRSSSGYLILLQQANRNDEVMEYEVIVRAEP
ncbi:hypothetical protein [Arenibaculum pallidiluteum]|uniref:hypothetical protein n=1 Tax=Arenibaculum pallidiluteum TaxID=2812559 RepID=UPI001A95E2A2|nr:hypothetical protein [Arenibaculum pallidiluteum]